MMQKITLVTKIPSVKQLINALYIAGESFAVAVPLGAELIRYTVTRSVDGVVVQDAGEKSYVSFEALREHPMGRAIEAGMAYIYDVSKSVHAGHKRVLETSLALA